MKLTRHIENVQETQANVTFTLVLRDARDSYTFGAQEVTIAKPFIEATVRGAINAATQDILRAKGNSGEFLANLSRQMNEEP